MEESTPPPIAAHAQSKTGSRWHKTLGIIAIVFGALGCAQAAIAPFSLIITKNQMEKFVAQGSDQMSVDAYLEQLSTISIQGSIAAAVLGIALLSGGIMLLKRKPKASILLQIWAVAKMLVGSYTTYASMSLTKLQMSIMTSSGALGDDGGATLNQFTAVAVKVGAVVGLIWLAALPIFLLIWLNRAKIKEDIRSW